MGRHVCGAIVSAILKQKQIFFPLGLCSYISDSYLFSEGYKNTDIKNVLNDAFIYLLIH